MDFQLTMSYFTVVISLFTVITLISMNSVRVIELLRTTGSYTKFNLKIMLIVGLLLFTTPVMILDFVVFENSYGHTTVTEYGAFFLVFSACYFLSTISMHFSQVMRLINSKSV